jgi:large subunit ribosomal protein L9
MKVVLLEDVPKLGKMGDLIQTKDGYARNYLLPKKLAVPANPQNLKTLEHQKTLLKQKQNRIKRDAEKLAQKIEKISCTISKPAGEEDKLFGSVTSLDIEHSLNEEGLKIDRKKILLEEPIKSLGIYKVPIKLHPEVTANIKIWVVKS